MATMANMMHGIENFEQLLFVSLDIRTEANRRRWKWWQWRRQRTMMLPLELQNHFVYNIYNGMVNVARYTYCTRESCGLFSLA